MIRVEFVNRSGRAIPSRFLERFVGLLEKAMQRRTLLARRPGGWEMTIAFLKPDEVRALNRRYRRKNYPTDVLSFASEAPSLGELAICPEVISRQAREHGLLVREELAYMTLHGVLHLLGFDHERGRREAERMFQLQDELWDELLPKLEKLARPT